MDNVFDTTKTFPLPRHLNDGEEIGGVLGAIEPAGEGTVSALIGPWAVLLPSSLKLPSGHIFVLHLDGKFYVRRRGAHGPL
jgi:hypothetical protein